MSPSFAGPTPTAAPSSTPSAPAEAPARRTYLLVDGENIDATLGMNVLSRRPNPEERPRWDRVSSFAHRVWDQEVVPLFFLNASSGQMPMAFVQALLAMGYKPIPLASSGTEKVVDVGIQRTLEALADRDGDVLLASHDGDFLPQMEALLGTDRRVGLLAFREFVNAQFTPLVEKGLETFDLEGDADAFTAPLPRVRIIPLDEFDPLRYL
ncbi:NYN domain-containing protein [Isoptericola cucumis]|uniref:Nuclease n=1 Tax=Isoptericola cucumis TaxID=1776856 RepID=A0ABQ2B3L9_9MICO|nr:NYN domain-containing protein [Isoptericola cucumis]GGI05602.1 nuclease [Isoptericola cucumis]